jgi:hypothetical protein
VKRSTSYRVRVRYKTAELAGHAEAGKPYGFVAKTGGWLWGSGNECYLPGTGTPVTGYQSQNTDWSILEGTWASGSRDFLPNFYLALENVSAGRAYIDSVWIQEDLGGGSYGPNIVSPWMAHYLYFEQRNRTRSTWSRAGRAAGVYLRPVILEKNEWTFNRIDVDGTAVPSGSDNIYFYGDWRRLTKVRWLQQAWWRYLQARWGYSTALHSWELLNEGNPFNGRHYTLADEFGEYMGQFRPNHHLVSTSNWHSFPKDQFWANPSYPHVDFADYHHYVDETEATFGDSALTPTRPAFITGLWAGAQAAIRAAVVERRLRESRDTTPRRLAHVSSGAASTPADAESYWYENMHTAADVRHRPHSFLLELMRDAPEQRTARRRCGRHVDHRPAGLGTEDSSGRAHLWIADARHTWNVVTGLDPACDRHGRRGLRGPGCHGGVGHPGD